MNAVSILVSDSIAILTINQPDSKVNVLSRALWSELGSAFTEVAKRADLHGLILESAKPGIFIAGADLNELANVPGSDHPPTLAYIAQGLRVLESLESLPFPTAACVDGAALGGGLEVALACDYRIAGTNPKAKFGLPEITLGLIPGWGGTQRLPRIVGIASAIEHILNSAPYDAETAKNCGLVTKIVPSDQLRLDAKAILDESYFSGSWEPRRERKCQPMEIGAFHQEVNQYKTESSDRSASLAAVDVIVKGCRLPLGTAIKLETVEFLRLAGSSESQKLIREFFASRKK